MNLKTYKYKPTAGYEKRACQICLWPKECCQHHINPGSDRANSPVIWICDDCHAHVHNPTAFKLPADWAYKNGYLSRDIISYQKRVKKESNSKCNHKTLFNPTTGKFYCQFCRKEFTEPQFGSTKKAEPYKKAKKK